MGPLISCVFFIAYAFSVYYSAKRAGRWSWPQFFVVVAALIVVPVMIVLSLVDMPWLQDKPGLFTLIATTLIISFVCVLAHVLKKYWPLPGKPLGK